MRSHEWIDQRSLALHEAVAARLEVQPELLEVARSNVKRWLAARPAAALREWERLLDSLPLPELLRLLRSPDEEAARLRQSSPFAGVLSATERQAILSRYESSRAWALAP
jgi:predicted NACHT family NTPase